MKINFQIVFCGSRYLNDSDFAFKTVSVYEERKLLLVESYGYKYIMDIFKKSEITKQILKRRKKTHNPVLMYACFAAIIILLFCAFLARSDLFGTSFEYTGNLLNMNMVNGTDLIFAKGASELTIPQGSKEDEFFSNQVSESIAIYYYGEKKQNIAEMCDSVEELLTENGIMLLENDVINVSLDSSVEYGMEIVIDSIETFFRSEEEIIPCETVINPSQTIPKGEKILVREGQDGKIINTYEVRVKNGEEQFSRLVSTTTVAEAVSYIYDEGVGGVFVAPDGTEYNYSYYLDVSATAYGESVGTHTYTGKRVEIGMIAVDPEYIPLGSNVYVIGNYGDYGVCAAEDIGGGIKGHKIDVYLHDEDVVRKFGIRKMRAYVLE